MYIILLLALFSELEGKTCDWLYKKGKIFNEQSDIDLIEKFPMLGKMYIQS